PSSNPPELLRNHRYALPLAPSLEGSIPVPNPTLGYPVLEARGSGDFRDFVRDPLWNRRRGAWNRVIATEPDEEGQATARVLAKPVPEGYNTVKSVQITQVEANSGGIRWRMKSNPSLRDLQG